MSSWQQFAVAFFGEIFPWVTIWVVSKYFLLGGKQYREVIAGLMAHSQALTQQVVAYKNPSAAEQFARTQARRPQGIKVDLDTLEHLDADVESQFEGDDEDRLL